MKVDSQGNLILPKALLKRVGWGPETEVEANSRNDEIVLRPARETTGSRIDTQSLGPDEREALFDDWLERFAGTADGGLTTDEVMRLTRGED